MPKWSMTIHPSSFNDAEMAIAICEMARAEPPIPTSSEKVDVFMPISPKRMCARCYTFWRAISFV